MGQDQSHDQELRDLRPDGRLHQPDDTGQGDHRGQQDEDEEKQEKILLQSYSVHVVDLATDGNTSA